MKFTILTAFTLELLESKVNRQIAAGWKPLGSVVILRKDASITYLQNMTLDL